MTEFDNPKSSYISAIQFGLTMGAEYNEAKHGNDILHKFCENLIDNSNYNDLCKTEMKNELDLVKETLSQEIESFYKK